MTRGTPPTPATTPATRGTPATSATTPEPLARDGGNAAALTLAPVALSEFLSEHWDRRPLLVDRDESGRFDGLLSTDDVERIICGSAIRTPGFRLVKDGEQVPLTRYSEDIRWRPGAFTGMPVPARVAAEFRAGATLVVQALHLHWPPAALYCRGLEGAFGCPVQANAYWTPAAAQGFAVHHDTHDVFVLQVVGSKRWRVYEPLLELPLATQRWSPQLGEPGAPVMEFDLLPGDTLYLPRGWPHEAETSSAASLHLTVGLHPPTRLDALRAAIDACGDDVEFRRALGADGQLPPHLLERLASRLTADQVAAQARRRFLAGRRPILPDQLSQLAGLDALNSETLIERRPTVIADLDGDVLRFEGSEIALPPQAHEALEAVHAADGAFTAADLPGRLDAAGRLVLVRRLVREGYLRLVDVAPAQQSR